MIFTIRTIVGRENNVMNDIKDKIDGSNNTIKAILHAEKLRGYLFLEGDLEEVIKAVQNVPHVKGIIRTPVKFDEINKFLVESEKEIKLEKGDIIEVIGGPFKREKGTVERFDEIKREVVIKLLEATISIPITLSADLVTVIEKIKKEDTDDEIGNDYI